MEKNPEESALTDSETKKNTTKTCLDVQTWPFNTDTDATVATLHITIFGPGFGGRGPLFFLFIGLSFLYLLL